MFPPTKAGFCDVFGNVWEWCEDHFNGFKDYKPHLLYDDFSTPCFDGRHNMIMVSYVSLNLTASFDQLFLDIENVFYFVRVAAGFLQEMGHHDLLVLLFAAISSSILALDLCSPLRIVHQYVWLGLLCLCLELV